MYTQKALGVLDHDFRSLAEGVIIPHGIYDLKTNQGYINIGTSHDTSEFACDSLRQWWHAIGKEQYPQADSLLILCDGGGSNSARTFIFKSDLETLATDFGLPLRVAHYPAYLSKYNPIEHRLFPHLTRACQGVIFTSINLVKQLMEKTATKTGLRVSVNIIDTFYATGRKVASDFKLNMHILFDPFLPHLNYFVFPANLPLPDLI